MCKLQFHLLNAFDSYMRKVSPLFLIYPGTACFLCSIGKRDSSLRILTVLEDSEMMGISPAFRITASFSMVSSHTLCLCTEPVHYYLLSLPWHFEIIYLCIYPTSLLFLSANSQDNFTTRFTVSLNKSVSVIYLNRLKKNPYNE